MYITRPKAGEKKNNAHLTDKDKLFMQAKNLELELVKNRKLVSVNKRPIKYY